MTIAEVDQDSIAAQKGLRVGDVIFQANGESMTQPSELKTAFTVAKQDGKPVLLRVKSGDIVHYVALAANAAG